MALYTCTKRTPPQIYLPGEPINHARVVGALALFVFFALVVFLIDVFFVFIFFSGAYGAHGLSGKSDKVRTDWKTATQYHLCHALAIATLPAYQKTPARAAAGLFFSTGITLFSGSIYYACMYV